MARRPTRRSAPRGFPIPFRAILLVLVLAQAAWIGLFVRSTGVWLPGVGQPAPRASRTASPSTAPGRDAEINALKLEIENLKSRLFLSREERQDDRDVQALLEKRGSKGN